MNIHNFANRQMCEYASIFPTVTALLDHLLFTNGNGYDFDSKSGMIYQPGRPRMFIDQFPALSDADWDKLIGQCHEKERGFAERFSRGSPIDEQDLAEDCAKYQRVSVTDEMFTEDYLYTEMVRTRDELATRSIGKSYYRPYPFHKGYCEILKLNQNTPVWFLQIAVNFCRAWVRFLTQEIDTGNVWIKPSLRPVTEESKARAAAMASLMGMIKKDSSYDGWADNIKEPQRDYADLEYTIEYRDKIAAIVPQLLKMMENRDQT